MQGAVSLLNGSCSIFSSGIPGRSSFTIEVNRRLVTTKVLSRGTRFANLSTVFCKKDFSVPATCRNCFGRETVLIGQKRVPFPPAIITHQVLSLNISGENRIKCVADDFGPVILTVFCPYYCYDIEMNFSKSYAKRTESL